MLICLNRGENVEDVFHPLKVVDRRLERFQIWEVLSMFAEDIDDARM